MINEKFGLQLCKIIEPIYVIEMRKGGILMRQQFISNNTRNRIAGMWGNSNRM